MSALLEKAQKGWQEAGQQLRAVNGRVVLALSILQHRPWCKDCRRHAEQARRALLGASIQELAEEVYEQRGDHVGVSADGAVTGGEVRAGRAS